jgi:RNA polymerase sigma factor (sigma-70 family)
MMYTNNTVELDRLEKIKQGDDASIEKLYNDCRATFLSFAAKYGIKEYEAIDIYQEAIVAFIEQVRKGKIKELKSAVSTYLIAIGKFMIFKKLKTKSIEVELNTEFENTFFWEDYSAEQQQEQVQLLQQFFMQLGNQCKKIITLFYYEEKKLDEIVELLGYENKEVAKSQKSRCIKQLKNLIQTHHES